MRYFSIFLFLIIWILITLFMIITVLGIDHLIDRPKLKIKDREVNWFSAPFYAFKLF